VKPPAPKAVVGDKGGASEEKAEAPKKKELVTLVDGKRSQNINIALARFRMTHPAIRDAILAMDDQVLTPEKMESLLKCAPTPEEIDTVVHYDGNVEELANTEHFFHVLSVIPRVENRIKLTAFKYRFEPSFAEVAQQLNLCEETIKVVRNSSGLRQVIEVTLGIIIVDSLIRDQLLIVMLGVGALS
jgi:hypothetical protein